MDRLVYDRHDVRRLRGSDSTIDRLTGEVMKLTVEAAAAGIIAVGMAVLASLHPDVALTWRLRGVTTASVWIGVSAFVANWKRCWFDD